MDELKVFENEEFGKVRMIEENGKPLFCGSDVAKALGYSNERDAIKRHCAHVVKHDVGVQTGERVDGTPASQVVSMTFIPEGDVYRLITHSKLPKAEEFERWVFDDVLPSIRETGGYVNNDELFISTYFDDVPEEMKQIFRTNLAALRHKNEIIARQKEEIEHKEDVIVGLVEDIDLATKRQRINQIIKFRTKDTVSLSKKWNLLYSEFEKKYHVNLSTRLENYKDAFKPKLKNKVDVIERQMNMVPQLYEVCCKLFENDVKILMKEWESTIAC